LRSTRLSLAIICLGIAALACPVAALGEEPAREPFFPRAGNDGYEVRRYEVTLAYRPKLQQIDAQTLVAARATKALQRFSLDFFGPRVLEVRVAGRRAPFQRREGKLLVRSQGQIEAGQNFQVSVRYRGTPPKITDPDGSGEGWYPTDDGVLAVGEPQGTAAWIPCNNVPADKAAFSFTITVPQGLQAVANGRLVGQQRDERTSTFSWVERAPMSTYLAVLAIGRGRLVKSRVGRLPLWTFVDPRLERRSQRALAQLPEIIRFQARLFGPYPFSSAGSIVDYAPGLGYALETQSRPIYNEAPVRTLLVHETAHQWFGDSVGLERWPQIWLNEGFATWIEWLYAEHHGGRTAAQIFRRLYRVPASNRDFWNPPSGRPGTPKHLFSPSIYIRGAMALQALRAKIGTAPMLRVLRRWAIQNRHASGSIADFALLAEETSGQQLDALFRRWLYQRGKP
jgi:aminopeptidase N